MKPTMQKKQLYILVAAIVAVAAIVLLVQSQARPSVAPVAETPAGSAASY